MLLQESEASFEAFKAACAAKLGIAAGVSITVLLGSNLAADVKVDVDSLPEIEALDEISPEDTLIILAPSGGADGSAASLSRRIEAWRASASAKAYEAAAAAAAGAELNTRFAAAAGTFTYTYGDVSQFFAGLEGLVGSPVPNFLLGVALEHASDEAFEAWNSDVKRVTTPRAEHAYVVERPAGDTSVPDRAIDATGDRAGWQLCDFAAQPSVRRAGLLLAEVVGVRLYTGPMYVHYNSVLRRRARGAYVTTLHTINSAILKLSKQTKACTVYRGVSGGVLPDAFWEENEHGVRGGVELGFMSTTTEKHVALRYMVQSGQAARMLFQIRMGMIDRGADVSALSQFPGESEILFAPLTGLEVMSPPCDIDGVLVVELRLSCNMHDLTIEEVAGKMRASHLALLDSMAHSLKYVGAPEPTLAPLRRVSDAAATRGAEFFNVPSLFLKATGEALEARGEGMAMIASAEMWSEVEGEGAAVAARMRDVAAMCAREEVPEPAAKLLVMAVERQPASAASTAMVSRLCDVWRHQPSAEQQRALEALSMLLVDGSQQWSRTMVALAKMGGHEQVATRLALSHGRPGDVVQRTPFDEDATAEACKGNALLQAAATGNVEAVALALSQGTDANTCVTNGVTPLMLASRAGNAAVQALLDARADPRRSSTRGCTALGLAVTEGSAKLVMVLLAAGALINSVDVAGFSPLMTAASRGRTDVVTALVNGKADVHQANEKLSGTNALMLAAAGGAEAAVRVLLDSGSMVVHANKKGNTALLFAAHSGHAAILEVLLGARASVNHANHNGNTALIRAADNDHIEAVKVLLEAGGSVNHTNNRGETALFLAKHENVVALLVNAREQSEE